MYAASSAQQRLPRCAASDSIGEVPAAPPMKPNLERYKYRNPRQGQRPPFHKKPDPNRPKPDDEHKVDDYA